eukprot:g16162.t1
MEERVHRRHANPVDFFMDLVTPDASNSQVDLFVEQYRDRLEPRVLREVERGLELEMPSALDLLENVRAQMLEWGDMPPVRNSVYGVRFRRQLWYVFLRQVRLRWRDRNGLVADLLGAAVKALVVGIVYMRTGELAAQQQVSFFFMLCMTTAIDGLKNMPMVIGERTIVKMETSEVLYSDWAYIISFTVLNLCQALVVHSIFIAILFAMSGLRWTMFPSAYLWSTLLSASWSVDQRVIQAVSESPIGDSRRWNGRPGGALAISAQKGREGLDVFQELLGAPKSSPAFRLEAGGR